jgi:hypothetical protein
LNKLDAMRGTILAMREKLAEMKAAGVPLEQPAPTPAAANRIDAYFVEPDQAAIAASPTKGASTSAPGSAGKKKRFVETSVVGKDRLRQGRLAPFTGDYKTKKKKKPKKKV